MVRGRIRVRSGPNWGGKRRISAAAGPVPFSQPVMSPDQHEIQVSLALVWFFKKDFRPTFVPYQHNQATNFSTEYQAPPILLIRNHA